MESDERKIQKSIRLAPDTVQRLNKMSEETGVTRTKIIEFALEKEFQYYNSTGKVK